VPLGIGELVATIAGGLPVTIGVALAAWALSCAVGLLLDVMRTPAWPPVRGVVNGLILAFRGLPELVAVFFLFYGLSRYWKMHPFTAAILALALTQAPFVAEIFKAAFLTVPAAQRQAGASVGLTPVQVFALVVVPQAARFAMVPLLNVLVGLTKGAAITSAVGVPEVIYRGTSVMAIHLQVFPATLAMCVVYLTLTLPMTYGVRLLEVRLRGTRPLG
jgi:His/Glu/Gln/Arg/opine family amino acid ABC transporter permease subunit